MRSLSEDGAFEDRFAIDPSSGNIFSTSVINTKDALFQGMVLMRIDLLLTHLRVISLVRQ